jgi:hypothetical protein
MSNGYANKNLIKDENGVTCPASTTTTIASFKLSDRDSLSIQTYTKLSSVLSGDTITIRLEDSPDNGATWRDMSGYGWHLADIISDDVVAEIRRLSGFQDGLIHAAEPGDHLVVEDVWGVLWGVAILGATITSDEWAAVPVANRATLDASGWDEFTDVAAEFSTAFNGITGIPFTVNANTVNAVTFVSDIAGGSFGVPELLAADGSPSAITTTPSVVTPASAVLAYHLELHTQISSSVVLYPQARIVIEVGADSQVEVDSVYVTRRL